MALSRPLRVAGLGVAGLLLTSFFVYLGFPYERLAGAVSAQAGAMLGARVDVQEVAPYLALAGLGLQARGVRADFDDGRTLRLDRAALRPAWSLAWLRGVPAVHARLSGPLGEAAGTFVAEGAGAWSGRLSDVDLEGLPLESVWPGGGLQGRVDADVDLRFGGPIPEGSVAFEAREGTLKLPNIPVPLPYERWTGDLELGGEDAFVEVESFELEGPLLNASVGGRVEAGMTFGRAPLRLEVELHAPQPATRSMLQSAGVRLDREGRAKLQITGTPQLPRVKYR